jgi:hypothetical protein
MGVGIIVKYSDEISQRLKNVEDAIAKEFNKDLDVLNALGNDISQGVTNTWGSIFGGNL